MAAEVFRTIAHRFTLSEDALKRHKRDHLPARMAKAQEAAEVASADGLLTEAEALRSKAYSLLLAAERAGDLGTALAGVREATGCLELLAKLLGELDERPTVNFLVAPEWLSLRATILGALSPYPEARAAVAARLSATSPPGGAPRGARP